MEIVADSCINADWSNLVIARDPNKVSPEWDMFDRDDSVYCVDDDDVDFDPDMEQLIAERPKSVAILLQSHGYDLKDLEYALGFVREEHYPY
jgi:hypothetical protein